MARGLLGFDVQDDVRTSRGGGAFLWTVVLLLLTGAAIASWIGSFYVVAHPEKPRCYRLLTKLKKLDSPKKFLVTEGPHGRFFSPRQLVEGFQKTKGDELVGFGKMGPAELEQRNAELLRMYIKNYKESKKAVPYVAGVFEVVESYELRNEDFFTTGVVAVTQAKDYPQMLMEFVFLATPASVNTIKNFLPIGREITLERSKDLAAVMHVERLSDSRMLFTVVPITYGSFQLKEGRGSFTLQSPEDLMNPEKGGTGRPPITIEAPLPIVNGMRLQKGIAMHAEYRRKALANAEPARPAANQIVGFRSGRVGEEPVEVATPVVLREASPLQAPSPLRPPVAPQQTAPRPPTTTVTAPARPALINSTSVANAPLPERFPLPPRPIVRAEPKPPMEAAPAAPVQAAPAAPVRVEPPNPSAPAVEAAPPRPVVLAMPAAPSAGNATAPTAGVSQSRLVTTKEASALVDSFDPASKVILGGEFVVTGVLGQRVAMRAKEALRDKDADPTLPGTTGAMIVVDFPKGVLPPAKDSTFSRDGGRGFLIKSVRRGQNGHITILAEDQLRP
jgi:hypothetical protein